MHRSYTSYEHSYFANILCNNYRLVDWRVYMIEEAEALLHSSKAMNKYLKTTLTLFLLFVISCVQFGCMDAGKSAFVYLYRLIACVQI